MRLLNIRGNKKFRSCPTKYCHLSDGSQVQESEVTCLGHPEGGILHCVQHSPNWTDSIPQNTRDFVFCGVYLLFLFNYGEDISDSSLFPEARKRGQDF